MSPDAGYSSFDQRGIKVLGCRTMLCFLKQLFTPFIYLLKGPIKLRLYGFYPAFPS